MFLMRYIEISAMTGIFKGFLNEKNGLFHFNVMNYNRVMNKKAVLGFSISYIVLNIFKFLTYVT